MGSLLGPSLLAVLPGALTQPLRPQMPYAAGPTLAWALALGALPLFP